METIPRAALIAITDRRVIFFMIQRGGRGYMLNIKQQFHIPANIVKPPGGGFTLVGSKSKTELRSNIQIFTIFNRLHNLNIFNLHWIYFQWVAIKQHQISELTNGDTAL